MKIAEILHGSFLYGTQTESSDRDIKTVFLPPIQELVLERAKHTEHKEKIELGNLRDQDQEFFSIQQFCKLAKQGQSISIEMLFAPNENVLETSEIWQLIVAQRQRFIQGDLKPFIGFAMSQALKNGKRSDRLIELQKLSAAISQFLASKLANVKYKLSDFLDGWSPLEYKYIKSDKNCLFVLERKLQLNADLHWCFFQVNEWIQNYGSRINSTAKSGKDFKALSHSLRVAYEVEEIYKTQNLVFPLKNADFLKAIKLGQVSDENYWAEYDKVLDSVMALQDNRETINQDWDWLDKIICYSYGLR